MEVSKELKKLLGDEKIKREVSEGINKLSIASKMSVNDVKTIVLSVLDGFLTGNLPEEYSGLATMKDKLEKIKKTNEDLYKSMLVRTVIGAVSSHLYMETKNKPHIMKAVTLSFTREGEPRIRDQKQVYSYRGIFYGKLYSPDGEPETDDVIIIANLYDSDKPVPPVKLNVGDVVEVKVREGSKPKIENNSGVFYNVVFAHLPDKVIGKKDIYSILPEILEKYNPIPLTMTPEVDENNNPYLIMGTITNVMIRPRNQQQDANDPPSFFARVQMIDDSMTTFEGDVGAYIYVSPTAHLYTEESQVMAIVRIRKTDRGIAYNGYGLIPIVANEMEEFSIQKEIQNMNANVMGQGGMRGVGTGTLTGELTENENSILEDDEDEEEEEEIIPPKTSIKDTDNPVNQEGEEESEEEGDSLIDL